MLHTGVEHKKLCKEEGVLYVLLQRKKKGVSREVYIVDKTGVRFEVMGEHSFTTKHHGRKVLAYLVRGAPIQNRRTCQDRDIAPASGIEFVPTEDELPTITRCEQDGKIDYRSAFRHLRALDHNSN